MNRPDTRACSLLHYAAAALFLLTPLLAWPVEGGAEVWLPVLLGVSLIAVTFLAEDRIGPMRLVRGSVRHSLELGCSALLAVSPWLFAFSDLTWRPHLLIGQVGIGVSILTQRITEARGGGSALSAFWDALQNQGHGMPIARTCPKVTSAPRSGPAPAPLDRR
jgi:hypothetical protein